MDLILEIRTNPSARAANAYWFAPVETSRSAIAEADQIVQSRSARFATADALLNGLEEASRK